MKHLRNYKIFEEREADESVNLNSLSDKDLIERNTSLKSHLKWLEEEIKDCKKESSEIERILYTRKTSGKYKYPDRLYNHKEGLNILIKYDIVDTNKEITKPLSEYNSKTIEMDQEECDYQWFVDDCRTASSEFKIIQEVTDNGSKYLLFYTISIYRQHYEDFLEEIRLEKIEPMD